VPELPIALWSVPRSASTAFERSMMARGDLTVLHEPFSLHYYFGPRKRSTRYDDVRPEADPDAILATIADAPGPVFLKDMAGHVADLVDDGFLARFTHTFLVRDPARTIPSLATKWPDFTDEEAGFEPLLRLVDLVTARDGTPVVVDADDLLRDPPAMMRAYCDAVGLDFRPDALHWEAGMPPEWEVWADWHEGAARSTGFGSPSSTPPPARDDPRVEAAYERCAPVYERLREQRLQLTG
jgi:hypothetical protein